ncbi:hypothetical protein DICPUDRAFT_51410 [Dictyostelium purpureum]|uniref:nitric oxide dioxygenase n=1 Tax=Dictyostelium purpureum TaxID=5786 RepID=F1A3M9_DICPU|nr:uncharacterized protein DICPUDRAFT_51410 [Dictyostelium purpureum]EGC29201.1 hypothetical protein DICPUDRAFT_51410 [Dictyostelium purpureum]|eukprot:XP_003294272.1 hypothetical protein DICPUDRAFT_51410 [Dictyostelium purpureum]
MEEILSQEQINAIKSTIPLLEEHGVKITSTFYKNLFEAHPDLINLFNHSNQRNGKQPIALANTIYQSALHIERMNEINLTPIVHKHVALGIKPSHYPIVGQHLIGALKQILGDEATPTIVRAWTDVYRAVAQALIEAEQELYYETQEQFGGWKDLREFVVDKKVEETPIITSFYLKPADGKDIAVHLPGQYITIKIELSGDGVDIKESARRTYIRHYSLSDNPNGEYYRISIKREDGVNGNPSGIVSNHLHNKVNEGDKLLLAVPAGDFVIDPEDETPVLLVCGGVGVNPLIVMAKETLVQQPTRQIDFIYSIQDKDNYLHMKELEELQAEYPDNFKLITVYTKNQGHITLDLLKEYTENFDNKDDTEVFLCGPIPFMVTVNNGLQSLGFPKENIHYELFGPLTPVFNITKNGLEKNENETEN